ncbi:MAG: hypothetical protein ACYC3X_26170 [Pirellulaceae bacterium]
MCTTTQQSQISVGMVRRCVAGLACAMLITIHGANRLAFGDEPPHYHPFLHQLTPSVVSRGEVLVIVGEGFGTQQGNQQVFYSRKIDGHIRPGRDNMRVVSWSDTTVRVQVPLQLERADSYVLYVTPPNRDVFTNTLSFTVRQPTPPAEVGGDEPRPRLDRVHPDTARPGDDVDIYGDFHKPRNAAPRVMLVNRHGVPVERALSTSIWTDRRIRARVPAGISGDDYEVFVRWVNIVVPGADYRPRPRESNRLQLVVRTTETGGWEHGNPRIIAIEPPGGVSAGDVIDILGTDLNARGRRNIAITPHRYHPFNGLSESAPVLQIISWSDTRIRARLPTNLRTEEHYVFMYWGIDYGDRSNQVSIQVWAAGSGGGGAGILPIGQNNRQPTPPARAANDADHAPAPPARSASDGAASPGPVPMTIPFVTQSGMTIDRVTVQGLPGVQTLILRGRKFGTVPGTKFVALNLNGVHRAAVTRWGDYEVQVRVPANLPSGEYRVLVYYDESLATSSNSQQVRLGGAAPPIVRRQPPPPARGIAVRRGH